MDLLIFIVCGLRDFWRAFFIINHVILKTWPIHTGWCFLNASEVRAEILFLFRSILGLTKNHIWNTLGGFRHIEKILSSCSKFSKKTTKKRKIYFPKTNSRPPCSSCMPFWPHFWIPWLKKLLWWKFHAYWAKTFGFIIFL